jgi:hypothetical protein
VQPLAHVRDETGRHIGVGIDARPWHQPFGMRRELFG